MNCTICGEKIRRGQPHYRGFEGKGPWKHISCESDDKPESYVEVERSLMAAMRDLKKARFEIRTHRWPDSEELIKSTIYHCIDAVDRLAEWRSSLG